MKMKQLLLAAGLTAVLGCDSEGVVRPAPTDVRMFHAAPTYTALAFFREAVVESALQYGEGASLSFDSGPYDFHLESALAGVPRRELSFSGNLSPSHNYTFVAVAPGGQPQVLVMSTADFSSSTTAQYTVVHAHPSLAAVDVYMVAAGTPLAGVAPQGSTGFGPMPATFEVTPATYRLHLTPAGDPATVLYESVDIDVTVGSDNVIVISDPGGLGTTSIDVTRVGGGTSRIPQLGLGSEVRVVQSVDDRLDRDLILDGDTAMPFLQMLPFGQLSGYLPVTAETHDLVLTPVGAPGTGEANVEFAPVPGRYYTGLFAGDSSSGVAGRVFAEDRRPIHEHAMLRVMNGAGLFGDLEIFVEPPGTDLSTVLPQLFFGAPNISPRLAVVPGTYEVTVRNPDTLSILAVSPPLALDEGGIYGVLMLNAANNSTVDLDYFYDFPP